ncbi:sigma-54-dependent Fis family transcriptional regulator [Ectothiorhodospira shaposhnikovii]|uniref:sigma-54-dependent transcriptional regulator n=1 Tax=Ectothiorhodospira shaposhnikovii TaxID=1054 RepID=UPI001902F9AE|nr:sigma-54 dependent transcriptional regulator [Ectothiorhodospira shaposhnikovii]MBK1674541.1 sigma-54-dependent Fis family transcriptional regulator [Ectothiorhodospira shaposhnikovii]
MSQKTRPRVLCVDDEVRSLETLERTLDDEFDVVLATSVEEARQKLNDQPVAAILCDQRMPGQSGVEFLAQVRELWPETARFILSGYTESEGIIRGLSEAGIFQYLPKPWHPEQLVLSVKNACRLMELQSENSRLSTEVKLTSPQVEAQLDAKKNLLKRRFAFDEIIRGESSPLNALCDQVARIAPYDISVLITGPSGSGKELFARALHYNSLRADQPFVVENCGALPDETLASELFGHRKGAFTGAISDHAGLFEQADGGSIFLDEIGDTSPAFQVMLLRVLQEQEVRRMGAERKTPVNVRVIAATNRDLEEDVRQGRFREDLYYRLAGVSLALPGLQQRPGDIPLLAEHFLERASAALGRRSQGFTARTMEIMQAYSWPGNVRELEHEVRRMLVLSDGQRLDTGLLTPKLLREHPDCDKRQFKDLLDCPGSLKERIELLEAQLLKETLIRNRWNKSRSAKELGLSRVGLRSKLERYGLQSGE